MAVLSQSEFAAQMIAQLRLLNPSASAEIGTPERLIIDTVATQGANIQIDLTGLAGALDIDAKFGSNLDKFTGLFRFQRIQSAQATGFVTFYSITPAVATVTIPVGTELRVQTAGEIGQIAFTTTSAGQIGVGSSNSGPVPVIAVLPGTSGNVAANSITIITTPGGIPGVSTVNNVLATSGGADQEDDNSYKVRFKNTVFRNLAGTQDQYLALAVSTAFSTKANVIGPTSVYQEYIQVPLYDDLGYSPGTTNTQPLAAQSANGVRGQYTTALSTVPYASAIYTTIPAFVSNGQVGAARTFFRQGFDFTLNSPPVNAGDTYRQAVAVNQNLEPYDTGQPNVTFANVFTGTTGNVTAATPGTTYLLEYSYQSSASRNDIAHNVTNAVDVYVDGVNPQQAAIVFPPPSSTTAIFNDNPLSPWYLENYRREGVVFGDGGGPVKRPMAGNFFTPLFQTPLTTGALPPTITVGNNTYTLGVHYWLVHDVSNYGRSIRGRDGIEWSKNVPGSVSTGTGNLINGAPNPWGPNDVVSIPNYGYDQNVSDLQAALSNVSQITTDVLAHGPRFRYFKLDISVVYAPGATASTVNLLIQTALANFFARQYFGSVVRLSDLLQVIHGVDGVSNVRWTNDYPSNVSNFSRVIETDAFGLPLLGATIDRLTPGTANAAEVQQLFINGNPQTSSPAGALYISTANGTTAPITVSSANNLTVLSASSIQSAINAISGQLPVTVTQDARTAGPSVYDPILSYTITYNSLGVRSLSTVSTTFLLGEYINDWDFFLRDNELPQLSPNAILSGNGLNLPPDTLPGLIIRPRAENTWILPPINSGLVLD